MMDACCAQVSTTAGTSIIINAVAIFITSADEAETTDTLVSLSAGSISSCGAQIRTKTWLVMVETCGMMGLVACHSRHYAHLFIAARLIGQVWCKIRINDIVIVESRQARSFGRVIIDRVSERRTIVRVAFGRPPVIVLRVVSPMTGRLRATGCHRLEGPRRARSTQLRCIDLENSRIAI